MSNPIDRSHQTLHAKGEKYKSFEDFIMHAGLSETYVLSTSGGSVAYTIKYFSRDGDIVTVDTLTATRDGKQHDTGQAQYSRKTGKPI